MPWRPAECSAACVPTETRHLDRLGQLSEFEQDSNTDSEPESNTDLRSAGPDTEAAAALQVAVRSAGGSFIRGPVSRGFVHQKLRSSGGSFAWVCCSVFHGAALCFMVLLCVSWGPPYPVAPVKFGKR